MFFPEAWCAGNAEGKAENREPGTPENNIWPARLGPFSPLHPPDLDEIFPFYPAGLAHSSRTAPPAALFIQMVDKPPERPFPLFIPLKHAGIGEDADEFVPDFEFYNFFRIPCGNRRAVFPF